MELKVTRNIGFILLSIFLILTGLGIIVPGFMLPAIIMGVLALVAGICILLGV